jgi:hypothetical protein
VNISEEGKGWIELTGKKCKAKRGTVALGGGMEKKWCNGPTTPASQ